MLTLAVNCRHMQLLAFRRLALAAAFVGPVSVAATRTCIAAPSAQATEAKGFYEKATGAFALGNYPEAAANYEKAFSLKPDPALLYNAAQAHRLAGNKTRALELYKSYLRVFPEGAARDESAKHAEALAQEKSRTATPTPSVNPAAEQVRARPDLSVPPPQDSPPAEAQLTATPEVQNEPSTPLLSRPIFWVVAGVLVVGAAVAIGIAASGDKDPSASLGRIGGSI